MRGEEFGIVGCVELAEKFGQLYGKFVQLMLVFQFTQQGHQAQGFHFAVFGTADEFEPIKQAQHSFVKVGFSSMPKTWLSSLSSHGPEGVLRKPWEFSRKCARSCGGHFQPSPRLRYLSPPSGREVMDWTPKQLSKMPWEYNMRVM